MKTFEVKTLGCKVNQYESQSLREKLLALGFKESLRAGADIYVVNTCAVTQKAGQESAAAIRRFNSLNPKAKIFVTGCSASHSHSELKNITGVACVLENSLKENLPEFILRKTRETSPENPGDSLGFGHRSPNHGLVAYKPFISTFHKHTRAFLKIQDGCNNGCSYCIIPKLRGSSRSRPLPEIIGEAKGLVGNGYKELVLCGICLGDYVSGLGLSQGLVRLITALEKIEGLLRIRLSSIEARDVSHELISLMAYSKKICPHLHIPFQSADDKVLQLMNRKMLSAGYRKLVKGLREFLPSIGITTDIMVGFPGEDDESFNNTVMFLKEVMPSRIHVFSFSPREGTPAFNLQARARPQVVKERQGQIKALARELALGFYRAHLSKPLEVLVESSPAGNNDAFYKGYSGNYIKVFIPKSEHLVNTVVTVRPIGIYRDGLLARVQK